MKGLMVSGASSVVGRWTKWRLNGPITNPLYLFLTLAALTGCSSNLYRTHRGDLIDDKVTAQRVQAALKAAGPDFQNIQVQATNSVITLTGTVKSQEVQTRADQIANGVHRATKVDDKLQVHL